MKRTSVHKIILIHESFCPLFSLTFRFYVAAEAVSVLFAGMLRVSKTQRHEKHFKTLHLTEKEKMALNQIKFNFSVGGVKLPKFFFFFFFNPYQKPNENSLWSFHKGRRCGKIYDFFLPSANFCAHFKDGHSQINSGRIKWKVPAKFQFEYIY